MGDTPASRGRAEKERRKNEIPVHLIIQVKITASAGDDTATHDQENDTTYRVHPQIHDDTAFHTPITIGARMMHENESGHAAND